MDYGESPHDHEPTERNKNNAGEAIPYQDCSAVSATEDDEQLLAKQQKQQQKKISTNKMHQQSCRHCCKHSSSSNESSSSSSSVFSSSSNDDNTVSDGETPTAAKKIKNQNICTIIMMSHTKGSNNN